MYMIQFDYRDIFYGYKRSIFRYYILTQIRKE